MTRRLAAPVLAVSLAVFLGGCGGQSAPAPATAPTDHAAAAHGGDHDDHAGPGHHASGMPHRFDDAERWAKVFDDPARDAWQKPDEVVALLDLEPGMTVVDVGAGTGYFMARLSRAVGPTGKVIATDVEPDMVRYLRERAAHEGLGNVEVVIVSPNGLGVAPGRADRILIVDTWHHLPDRATFSRYLAGALRPGGRVAIVDFTLEADQGPPRAHRLGPDAVIAELAAGGLTGHAVAETLPDQYVVVTAPR